MASFPCLVEVTDGVGRVLVVHHFLPRSRGLVTGHEENAKPPSERQEELKISYLSQLRRKNHTTAKPAKRRSISQAVSAALAVSSL